MEQIRSPLTKINDHHLPSSLFPLLFNRTSRWFPHSIFPFQEKLAVLIFHRLITRRTKVTPKFLRPSLRPPQWRILTQLGGAKAAAPPLLAPTGPSPPLPHHYRHRSSGDRADWSLPLLLGRPTARLLLSPPQDAASQQLEERPYGWGYSRPVVVLDVAWNFAFALVSTVVLLWTSRERPATPIRAWMFGCALQCLLHAGFVCFEYRRRQRIRERRRRSSRWVAFEEDEELDEEESRTVKKLESLNAMISLLWWMLGFYWIVVGGQTLLQDAPRLYWLTIVFLAFDVFFAIFCILLACVIGIALCCCLPCTLAFLHAVAGQEGASDTDLSFLTRFRFCLANQPYKPHLVKEDEISMTVGGQYLSLMFRFLRKIRNAAFALYQDGVELHALPCSHNFHSDCIVKWLRINATCPLCKFNIMEDDAPV